MYRVIATALWRIVTATFSGAPKWKFLKLSNVENVNIILSHGARVNAVTKPKIDASAQKYT